MEQQQQQHRLQIVELTVQLHGVQERERHIGGSRLKIQRKKHARFNKKWRRGAQEAQLPPAQREEHNENNSERRGGKRRRTSEVHEREVELPGNRRALGSNTSERSSLRSPKKKKAPPCVCVWGRACELLTSERFPVAVSLLFSTTVHILGRSPAVGYSTTAAPSDRAPPAASFESRADGWCVMGDVGRAKKGRDGEREACPQGRGGDIT
ncbi:hypothetical protein EYF80_049347 [Liparis tanakae]|uniref:Uncharacterized protein n=1 Tax=Liparis tanakae TaxID=230148 RepID=A0A4Z2FH38_9TELE|nr:hypothetical protein EYF80_049347 [Liparis tanakae]